MSQPNTKVVIFSAPSGAGKTTIVRYLLQTLPQLSFSISATTRPRRPHEIEGKDYYFMQVPDFKRKINEQAFVEWQEVYTNNFYGTLKTEVERIHTAGKVVIFDVDVKGGLNLKQYYQESALAIFVQPPSLKILEERLKNRKTETEESLQRRIDKAMYELDFAPKFDYVLVNHNLETTLAEAKQVVSQFLAS